jgi:hypothetical protein
MKPVQITVVRDGLFTSRRLFADISDTVSTAQRLVKEHFGRRPLIAVEVVATSTHRMPRLAITAQGAAVSLKPEAWEDKTLSLTSRPSDLYSVAVIAPNNMVRVLVNAKRLRRRQREIGATLVWAFVEVDQLCRKDVFEHRIALTGTSWESTSCPSTRPAPCTGPRPTGRPRPPPNVKPPAPPPQNAA